MVRRWSWCSALPGRVSYGMICHASATSLYDDSAAGPGGAFTRLRASAHPVAEWNARPVSRRRRPCAEVLAAQLALCAVPGACPAGGFCGFLR